MTSTTTPTNERTIGQWRIQFTIGSGSFAIVHLARHSVTAQFAAVKEINLDKLNTKLRQSLDSEISILKRISHPNIVKLYEVIPQDSHLFLVMEYCSGGDLAAFIKSSNAQNNNKGIGEVAAQMLMHQLAAGLQEMWSRHLVHRDLKPQNLLLSYNQSSTNGNATDTDSDRHSPSSPTCISTNITLKIADFGFARALQPQGLAETLCGSPLYMSPEIMHYHKYDAKADLWSVGAVLYELVVGRPPFTGSNTFQLLRNIERSHPGSLIPADVVARGLSVECKGLIQALLRRNPVERISFEEFFRHPFIRLTNSGGGNDDEVVMATPLPLHLSVPHQPPPTTTTTTTTSTNNNNNKDLVQSRVILRKARSTSHIPTTQVTTIVGFRNTTSTTDDDDDVMKVLLLWMSLKLA
jgi:serine/threonine-protein kinase ULK2